MNKNGTHTERNISNGGRPNIEIKMNQKELTKTFMLI